MPAVILAGGLGSRLQEETVSRPKPMVEIGQRPILWHIMKSFSHYGVRRFIICLGYRGYVIKEYFANYFLHNTDVTFGFDDNTVDYHGANVEPWKVSLIDTGEMSMTGGRLGRVREHLDPAKPFFMTYGDGVADVDIEALFKFHNDHGRSATMTVVRPPGRFGAVALDGECVESFVEKPTSAGGYINGGFFVLEPRVLDLISGDATVWEHEPLNTLSDSGDLVAYRHDAFWKPMDTLRERNELEALWASGDAPWKVW
ncbi:MAG: glucose-1-phosphate cytidylyltransferase [Acidimicrobiales bacterium]